MPTPAQGGVGRRKGLPQLVEVVYLTVERNDITPAGRVHWLMPCGTQIKDRQSSMRKTHGLVSFEPHPLIVRAAVLQTVDHRRQDPLRASLPEPRGRRCDETRDAAHGLALPNRKQYRVKPRSGDIEAVKRIYSFSSRLTHALAQGRVAAQSIDRLRPFHFGVGEESVHAMADNLAICTNRRCHHRLSARHVLNQFVPTLASLEGFIGNR